LNHLPEVKRFVKEAGHADSYNEITVKYIPGMKPEFVIFDDDGSELERHKLWGPDANRGMNAMMDCPPDSGTKPGGGCDAHKRQLTEEIHKFVQSKGFERSGMEDQL